MLLIRNKRTVFSAQLYFAPQTLLAWIGPFVAGFFFEHMFVDVAKYNVGRLRPNFIDNCRPYFEVNACYDTDSLLPCMFLVTMLFLPFVSFVHSFTPPHHLFRSTGLLMIAKTPQNPVNTSKIINASIMTTKSRCCPFPLATRLSSLTRWFSPLVI